MRALLMIHEVEPDGTPTVPDGWTAQRCGSYWSRVEHPSGRVVKAWLENQVGSTGLWAVVGDAADLADLDAIAEQSLPAREAWRRRAEPAILSYLRYWRTLRVDGFERDADGDPVAITDAVRQLVPRGERLPDPTSTPLPWDLDAAGQLTTQANAVIRVTGFSGVHTLSLSQTLAGHTYHSAFADEEDDGA
jgi:hypothetical protein